MLLDLALPTKDRITGLEPVVNGSRRIYLSRATITTTPDPFVQNGT
jgi:hypothetical protein